MAQPMVVQFAMSSNVAYDPHRRLMALGLFGSIVAEKLPWNFPAPPYLILGILNVPDGEHSFGVEPISGCVMEATPGTFEPSNGELLAVLQIARWTITQYEEVRFRVLMDGNPLHEGVLTCYPRSPRKVEKRKVDDLFTGERSS